MAWLVTLMFCSALSAFVTPSPMGKCLLDLKIVKLNTHNGMAQTSMQGKHYVCHSVITTDNVHLKVQ